MLGQRKSNGRTHEWRRAWCCHHCCENTCEERSGIASSTGKTVAGAGQHESKVEHASEGEGHKEQKASHGHNEARRLKLKSPPRLFAQRSEREQRADNDPERAKDSDCVCRPMQALSRPALLCTSHQSECFEKKNRKYARHQIQNDSTGKRKRNCEKKSWLTAATRARYCSPDRHIKRVCPPAA